MNLYNYLADLVVAVHVAYVGGVVFGLVAVLVGAVLGWQWVRNFWLRAVHLAMIAVVVAQAVAGVLCPLTVLENALRRLGGQRTYSGAFVGHWLDRLLFYEAPPWVFTVSYCVFGAAVLASFFIVPPRWPWRSGRALASSTER